MSSGWTDVQAVRGLECLGICVCVCPLAPDGFSGQWMHAHMDVHGLLFGYVARAWCVLGCRALALVACVRVG